MPFATLCGFSTPSQLDRVRSRSTFPHTTATKLSSTIRQQQSRPYNFHHPKHVLLRHLATEASLFVKMPGLDEDGTVDCEVALTIYAIISRNSWSRW
jgi:hypothetical protein